MSKISKAKINKHYNKFVIGFIILAVIIVLFTAYFAFAKTNITIQPRAQQATIDLNVPASDLNAKSESIDLSSTYTYSELSSSGPTEDGYATGTVTITNNYVADQQLVATTRLLSKDGVLFRTQENTVVPKGGSVTVEVQADQMGKAGDIGPSEFEIVALNATKKPLITGKSEEAMTGGVIATTVVTEEDITKAKDAALIDIKNKALEEFQKTNDKALEKQIAAEITESDASPKAGEKASSISVATTGKFYLLAFDEQDLKKSCLSSLKKEWGDTFDIVTGNNKIEYEIAYQDDAAIVKAQCVATAKINAKNTLIKKDQLTNKTANQVKKYLENFEEIESVEVKISPFWVKTTPFLQENILIEINSAK
jgi:hypothetical protein